MFTELAAKLRVAKYFLFAIAIVTLAIAGWCHWRPEPEIITRINDVITTVEVPVDRITTKTVTRYVKDPADQKALIAAVKEIESLKAEVNQLLLAQATNTSTGGGIVTVPTPTTVVPVDNPPVSTDFDYTDWRLSFSRRDNVAKYTLTQRFSVTAALGETSEKGTPVATVQVFELDKDGNRMNPMTVDKVTLITAAPKPPKWHLAPRVMGGVGVIPERNNNKISGELLVVGTLPLFRRGPSPDTANFAFLGPSVTYSKQDVYFGVVPVAVNIGRLAPGPLVDFWGGVFVGKSNTSKVRIGVIFLSTF